MRTSLLDILLAISLTEQATAAALSKQRKCHGHDLGTFQNPSARARPRFRYWIPDASVNLSTVRDDIADAGRIGAGGVELLGYYNYGNVQTGGTAPIPVDWTKYGWGTPAWRELQDAALQATKDNDLVIDLALGPNQGAGVPTPENADGLQWDLQPFNVSVPLNGRFEDVLPGWGTGPLVAASTGLVTEVSNTSSTVAYTLSAASLQDITTSVSDDGHVNVTFATQSSGQYNVVFAYYLIHSQYREQQTPELVISGTGVQQSPVASYVQNGSWVVDHFSYSGAQQVASFWNEHLLSGGNTSQLLRGVGNYLWEDSQEFPSNIFWTPKVPSIFQTQHGYSINRFIPVLMSGNGGGLSVFEGPGSPAFVLDNSTHGGSVTTDFRQTMAELNKEYLNGLTDFANSIGVESSTQVVYNWPVDMLANVPHVDAPETETLGFNHDIDSYLQYSGPADLAGKRVISSEAGAVMGSAYQQTLPELLWSIKRSVVGGVNNFVLHGYPFSGYYPNTTWPSYTTFFYLFSEMHNRHQPGWDYYRDSMDYIARTQQVMQSGVAKADLAFWLKSTDYESVTPKYWPNDLAQKGYTYEYLSPDNFDLPAAFFRDRILAPEQQGFKALIVRGNDTLTSTGVSNLLEWAKQGLPVVLSGGVPTNISGTTSPSEAQSINASLAQLVQLPNVHSVPYEDLAKSLSSIGIQPRTSLASSSEIWYSRWRESDSDSAVYLYYDALGQTTNIPVSNKTVTFAAVGQPFIYDAWTGAQTPVPQYTQTNSSTTISLSLAGNQTTIVAFRKHDSSTHKPHPSVGAGDAHKSLAPVTLSNWSLTVESWSPPADLFDIEGTVKQNTTYSIPSLLPWNKLNVDTNLTYTAGRGYYSTTFSWPPSTSSKATGAYITMSPIFHTAVLFINGHRMPPLDVTAPRADISAYLQQGENIVEIVVSTPLGNALIPIQQKLLSMGAGPLTSFTNVAEYGLVGEVVLRPYTQVRR